jgi:uncharacterized protein YecE (DUF72 family)
MNFRIGCAIWAYKPWVGELYPPGSRAGEFLKLYGQRFTTVEGNTTFYSTPDAATVARWAKEVPEGFQFCPKLPRDITHQGVLAPHIKQTIAFLELMQGLGDRLGPLFAQLPPGYGVELWEDLLVFLQAWPKDAAPLSLEVRHRDWFQEPHATRLNDTLAELGIGRVLLDTRPIYDCPDDPQLASERRKPQVPLALATPTQHVLVRYISHPDPAFNQPYWDGWRSQVAEWVQQGKHIYFFMHCPVEERSPDHARQFQHGLEAQGIAVPPLPWDAIAQPPVQLGLF